MFGTLMPKPAEPAEPAVRSWPAPTMPHRVDATLSVPGSKSQTNRALVLALLAAEHGASTISGALRSRDTDLMIDALTALGVDITETKSEGTELTVAVRDAPTTDLRIDCGLAGTVLRFLPALAALGRVPVTFDGDEQARSRPITPLLDCLRGLGVSVSGDGMPFVVSGGGGVPGGIVEIDASASSQFVSGLLLSGAMFTDGLSIVHTGAAVPSAPHIAMTVAMLREAAVEVDDFTANRWHVRPGRVAARHWRIEPDLSNAVPFLAAALICGGSVRLAGWPPVSTQPISTVIATLRKLGAVVVKTDSYLEVAGDGEYGGFDVDLNDVGELTPAVAALAALATPGSVSRISGIAHLRGHETDRLAALSAEINRIGGRCEETGDGLLITARPMHGGTWRTYADHRMAMAGAMIGLRVPGVTVQDIGTTAKTLPSFTEMWSDLLGGRTQ
jgi:3-phosphoshikimate 1-carboxyvinyltransferase